MEIDVGSLIKMYSSLEDYSWIGIVLRKREFFIFVYWLESGRFEWEAIVNIDEVLG